MSFMLDFKMHDLWLYIDECVYQMHYLHGQKDEEGFQRAFKDYELYSERYRVGKSMVEANLEDWDWKWAADTGNLSDYDWELFGKEIIEAGVNKEEHDKKWRSGRAAIATVSKTVDG